MLAAICHSVGQTALHLVLVHGGVRRPKLDAERGDNVLNPTAIFDVLSPSTEYYDHGVK
jgi:hypothetical protein